MNHQSKQIKVKFSPEKMKHFYDPKDKNVSGWLVLKKFLEPKNWVLEGNREELESQLEEALGGNLWDGDGWYQDNFIIRFINHGDAGYIL